MARQLCWWDYVVHQAKAHIYVKKILHAGHKRQSVWECECCCLLSLSSQLETLPQLTNGILYSILKLSQHLAYTPKFVSNHFWIRIEESLSLLVPKTSGYSNNGVNNGAFYIKKWVFDRSLVEAAQGIALSSNFLCTVHHLMV